MKRRRFFSITSATLGVLGIFGSFIMMDFLDKEGKNYKSRAEKLMYADGALICGSTLSAIASIF